MSTTQIQLPIASFALLETTVPVQQTVDLGTVVARALAFDDTSEEYANAAFEVPGDIDTSGAVTFRAFVSPATGAASKNVALTFGHKATGDDEAVDGAYTEEDSGDQAITATTGYLTVITWTETVANLGWTANELVHCRVSRPQASANNLVGDMYLVDCFTIDVPVTA